MGESAQKKDRKPSGRFPLRSIGLADRVHHAADCFAVTNSLSGASIALTVQFAHIAIHSFNIDLVKHNLFGLSDDYLSDALCYVLLHIIGVHSVNPTFVFVVVLIDDSIVAIQRRNVNRIVLGDDRSGKQLAEIPGCHHLGQWPGRRLNCKTAWSPWTTAMPVAYIGLKSMDYTC